MVHTLNSSTAVTPTPSSLDLDRRALVTTALLPASHARSRTVEHGLARAEGYHGFFNHCKLPRKVSYSGVSTYVRSESGLKTLASTTSLGDAAFFGSPGTFSGDLELSPERLAALDSEGRVLVTDHGHFVLFNVYAPCIRCAPIPTRPFDFVGDRAVAISVSPRILLIEQFLNMPRP